MTSLNAPYSPGTDKGRAGPFIVLEGVSGVGKSTLSHLLSERLNAAAIHTLTHPHSGWSGVVNDRLRPLPQFAFYLSGLLYVSDTVREGLSLGPVIADRYTSSVMACHAAVNRVGLDQVDELIAPFRPYLVAPDITFYLTSSVASLRERMGNKTDIKQDDTDLFVVPGRLDLLQENFRAVADDDPSAVVLSTDRRSPNDLAEVIIERLEGPRA